MCSRESLKTVHVITGDPDPSIAALDRLATTRRSQEVLLVDVGGPRPGLGEVGRRLAEAGVNVGSALSIENGIGARIALAVDEPQRARKALDTGEPARPTP